MTSLRRREWVRALGLVAAVMLVCGGVAAASPGASD